MIMPQVIKYVPKISDAANRHPEINILNGNFLKYGSHFSIHLPIHRTGWGRNNGSPRIKSRRNAAGSIYRYEVISISGKNPPKPLSNHGILL
jgi:hypothetical protein